VYIEVVQYIAGDPLQNKATHAVAKSIINALAKLETGFLTAFWSCVLNRTNMASNSIFQSEKADLGFSASLLQSLSELFSASLLQSLSEFVGMLHEKNKFDEFVEL